MGGVEPAGRLRPRAALAAASASSRRTSSSSPGAARSSSQPPPPRVSSCGSRQALCAAIPVIKVLRESFVVSSVHRVLGIVNGTTNFMLTEMETGEQLRGTRSPRRRSRGFAEADPTDDISGADAAAKMAILATVAFNSRFALADVAVVGIDSIDPLDIAAARELEMVIRVVGSAQLVQRPRRCPGSPGVRRPPPRARRGRRRLQRRHAPGRRDSRDHARGSRRGRARNGVSGDRRHGERDRDDGNRLPPKRRGLARACRGSSRLATTARPGTSTSRSTTSRASSRTSPRSSRSARSRWPGCFSTKTATASRCTSLPTRRAKGSLTGALDAITALAEVHESRCPSPSSPIAALRGSDGRRYRPLPR